MALATLRCSPKVEPEPTPSGPRRNVLLISVDSLRADHLGCYGYTRPTSPIIDAVAQRGTRFERVVSSASWTLPAHTSLLSGLSSHAHGVVHSTDLMDQALPLLVDDFRRRGYRTGGIVSGPFMGAAFGFARHFDTYDDELARVGEKRSHTIETSSFLLSKSSRWLETHRGDHADQPFFLFVHMWDVHYDYTPPAPYDTRFDPDYRGKADGHFRPWHADFGVNRSQRDIEHVVSLYDGEIAYTDQHIGRILDKLTELGLADNTIVCITADHGDEFMEHGQGGHQRTLYREVLDVPCIIAGPGVAAGMSVAQPIRNWDIVPTLVELSGGRFQPTSSDPAICGQSLVGVLNGATATASPLLSETYYHWMKPASKTEGHLASVELNGWKLIVRRDAPKFEQLFDLASDPGEKNNLIEKHPDRAADLRRMLDDVYSNSSRYTPLEMTDPDVRRDLIQSGYLNANEEGADGDDAADKPSSNVTSSNPASRSDGSGD